MFNQPVITLTEQGTSLYALMFIGAIMLVVVLVFVYLIFFGPYDMNAIVASLEDTD